jgi:hypothetical protein
MFRFRSLTVRIDDVARVLALEDRQKGAEKAETVLLRLSAESRMREVLMWFL